MKRRYVIPILMMMVLAAVYSKADAYRDKTAPIVTVFSIPSTSNSLTVPISAFAATDNVAVTGYMVTQTSTQPSARATGWTTAPPASYTFSSAGTKTLYAWAKDAAGNVSASKSATVTITLSGGGGTGGGTGGPSAISGVVGDIVTGSAISGAVISDGTNSTTTNSTGAYTLSEPAGSYTLTISKSGYLTTSQTAAAVSGATTTVNWALTRSYGNQAIPAAKMSYVILAWNDLGMHCDQNDYSYFMVLPPYNTLHAQVFRRGGEGAGLITSGVTVSYSFPKKTNSALHTNFWAYAPQYGFNVPTNVGISGTPLAGNMTLDAKGLSWEAVGIPITPYDDDGTWDPYGTAVITVKDSSGNVLQSVNVVAPVSTEMMCSNCHGDGTGNQQAMQLSILQAHDSYNGTTLAADQAVGKVHSCSECHSDNALGAPGKAGVESLSLAMHNFHKDKMNTTPTAAATTPGCYNCHPGPKTQCMRGIMFRAGKACDDCHGDMYGMTTSLQNGRQAWLQEPQCGGCHGAAHAENANTLYRNSVIMNGPSEMNGKIYCEACHNGTHAELTTANPADPTIPQKFQGDTYWIWSCTVCHSSQSQRQMHSGSSTTTSGGSTDN
ncbi:MAG: carboxypeptidase regulatory-like domain-containing protein [Acidobacteriota bacterium]